MYKKYTRKLGIHHHLYHKILLTMRLATVMLIASLMQVSASTLAQKISMERSNANLKTIFREIKSQTGYNFLYTDNVLKNTKPVTIKVNGADLTDVLKEIFSEQPVTYELDNKTVVIKRKEPGFFENLIANFRAIEVRGKILDEKGQPLVGATVSIRGKNRSVKTDENGAFYLDNVGKDDKLVISYIGYQNREVDAASEMGSLTMVVADQGLEEVIVNAGYYTVKDSERTGSISRITSKDIEKQPVTNILATMQGRMAGVDIIQDSGSPGSAFQIRIRGINSLRANGNEPLYIIDGSPYSSETVGAINTSGVFVSLTNPLNSINPSDIESIEVLKDADATAIYGSRGANGVVLITTKKGMPGKTKLSIDASTGLAKVARFAKLLNTQQYINMRETAFANDGLTTIPDWAVDVNGMWNRNRYTDWQKELIGGTAEINNLQASVSGGSASTQYLLSGNYRTETTVMPGDYKYKKGSVHFSMNHVSEDQKFKMVFSSNYVIQNNDQPAADLTGVSLTLAPNAPAPYDGGGNLNWENGTWENPLAMLQSKFLMHSDNLTVNSVLSYNILPNLQLKSSFGLNGLTNDERRTQPHTIYNPAYGLSSSASNLNTSHTALQSWIVEPQINYNQTIFRGKLEALVGSTLQNQNTRRLYESGSGFSSNSLINDMASAFNRSVERSDQTEYKYHAIFARINYNRDDRYILNITGRRDGSSRFGPGKKFANFGAVGLAWLFSNEGLLKNSKILSFGKLRGSYGITGNDQIGDYQFLDTYGSSGESYEGVNGLQPSRLYNPTFGWESNRKFEIALETGFFKDRVFLTSAFYVNRSSNQLVGIPLPGTTGFTVLNANLDATVENRGVEFTLRTINLKNDYFSWISSFNISTNRNKLISFPGLTGSSYASTYVIGQSLNIRKLYHYKGINQEKGIYEFEDVNADGVLSSLADRQTVVDFTPDYFGGFQNQLTYKGFQLDFLLQFVKQKSFAFSAGAPGTWNNQLEGNQTGWKQTGDNSVNQMLTVGYNVNAMTSYDRFRASDASVVDASYIRLKNISLIYAIPQDVTKKIKCRLSLQGQNLLTFTPYKGSDPEFKFAGWLPPLRVISAGAQFIF
jgi:TonB-linked SusC/RagA family outer membrane protein